MNESIKVMLVDDDEKFVDYVAAALKAKGYQVGVATSKLKAQDLAKSDKPNLIILGTILPRGDAFHLHKWLKQVPKTCDVPLVVIDAAPVDRETMGWNWAEGMQLEADVYLSKPIPLELLIPTVEALLEETTRTIKVLIVDDHAVVREGVRALLSLQNDIQVIGEAVDGQDAIEKVGNLMPEVVLMDIAMPVMNGLEATKQILSKYPKTRVLILTQHDEPDNMYVAKQIGAQGFIPKSAASSDLTTGIRVVDAGRYFPKSFAYISANWQEGNEN